MKVDLYLKEFAKTCEIYIRKAAEYADRKLSLAQEKVKKAQESLSHAQSKIIEWKRSIDDYKARLQRRSDEIEEAKKKFATDCKAECGEGKYSYIGCFVNTFNTTLSCSQLSLSRPIFDKL